MSLSYLGFASRLPLGSLAGMASRTSRVVPSLLHLQTFSNTSNSRPINPSFSFNLRLSRNFSGLNSVRLANEAPPKPPPLQGGHDVIISASVETAQGIPGEETVASRTSTSPTGVGSPTSAVTSTVTTSVPEVPGVPMQDAALWYSNVVPVRMGWWDVRYLFVSVKPTTLATYAESHLLPPTFPHPFVVRSVVASPKEGGMVLNYSYGGETKEALEMVAEWVRKKHVRRFWEWWQEVGVWEVKGHPFVEDMTLRFPSPTLRVEFLRGPDLTTEQLFREFRPYGKIVDVQGPFPPQVAGNPRYAFVTFRSLRSATTARNSAHGEENGTTLLGVSYERRQKVFSSLLDWINKHMRAMVLAATAIAAFVSYTLLDPLREFFIINKVTNRFSLSRLESLFTHPAASSLHGLDSSDDMDLVKVGERLKSIFESSPDTFVVITGPEGSGKKELLTALGENVKHHLVIDAEALLSQSTDERVLAHLAQQTGYRPSFSGFSKLAGLADAGITAMTGQKANLSSTPQDSAKSVLEKVAGALGRIVEEQAEGSAARAAATGAAVHVPLVKSQKRRFSTSRPSPKVSSADKAAGEMEGTELAPLVEGEQREDKALEAAVVQDEARDAIHYPVVVITGFLKNSRGKAGKNAWMSDLLAEWGALLVQNDLAHVVFETGNPGAGKTLGKFLPSRPFEVITLTDAPVERATRFVQARLSGEAEAIAKRGESLSAESLREYLEGLGGRMTDLSLWVQKVKAGLTFKESFEELVSKSISEIRKSGFGDNPDETKKLPWSQQQFWQIVLALADKEEVSFDALKYGLVFRGDESPLLAMEEEQLISISLQNGRPYSVHAARPVYRTAFKHIVNTDVRYTASMNWQLSKYVIAKETENIRTCETELSQLASIIGDTSGMKSSLTREARQALEHRANHLAGEVAKSTKKIGDLSVTATQWKGKMLESIRASNEDSSVIWN
ncbi:hypothetical protein M427DRAFT_52081 [Gonapodya prolifera JEL478]|uniref:Mitochondrial escape protein 2 n=1 Tax=Gonapodya prolifera (strain JEL478) TaxID=1344416 RepID=A0A139AVG1_GONPJ|nr:hypothetical protein M427DRAFT_52081 [Gonapodya prolifera JEL478]|eukprot:KXS20465.1 hypothetical protein M427DRAFT_52081 [Gonapodya prolifera JEL478]